MNLNAASVGIENFVFLMIGVLITVVSTFVTNYLRHRLALSKDRRLRKEELDHQARYPAIRIVCILDPFISECDAVVHDSGEADEKGEMCPRVSAPTLVYPDDIDWKVIEPDLMYRVLNLPNELDIADQAISIVVDLESWPPDYFEVFEERAAQYARLGIAALDLATEIRETYEIPKRDYKKWDPKERFEEAIAKIKKARTENGARLAKSLPISPPENS